MVDQLPTSTGYIAGFVNHQQYHPKLEAVFFENHLQMIWERGFLSKQKSFQDKIPTEREVLYNDILNVGVFVHEGSQIGYLFESNNEEVLCKHVQTALQKPALQKPRKKISNKIATKTSSSPFGNLVIESSQDVLIILVQEVSQAVFYTLATTMREW